MTEPTITQADIDAWEKLGPAIFHMEVSGPQALAHYREAAVAELRAALRTATDALVRHHQWHAAQTTPDAEFGFIPADEYADSGMYEETVAALALANPLLADGPVNSATLSQKETSHDD